MLCHSYVTTLEGVYRAIVAAADRSLEGSAVRAWQAPVRDAARTAAGAAVRLGAREVGGQDRFERLSPRRARAAAPTWQSPTPWPKPVPSNA